MDDLRRPLGLLFSVLGVILLLYSAIKPESRAALDPGVNVNLWVGLALLVFGLCMLGLSFRRAKS